MKRLLYVPFVAEAPEALDELSGIPHPSWTLLSGFFLRRCFPHSAPEQALGRGSFPGALSHSILVCGALHLQEGPATPKSRVQAGGWACPAVATLQVYLLGGTCDRPVPQVLHSVFMAPGRLVTEPQCALVSLCVKWTY